MKNRSIFVAVLSLFLSIPFFSFSAFGMASEEDKEKKVLYFHVGPAKTGTKTIQFDCRDRRDELAKLGVFYPPTENEVNHTEEIRKLLGDTVDEAKEWILNIKHQSQGYKSILLSTELAAQIIREVQFCDFLIFLNQHFRVKYIYCRREIIDSVRSGAIMNIMLGIPFNLETTIKTGIESLWNAHDFYSRLDTTFLSYEELAKSGEFTQTFFRRALELPTEIPNRSIQGMGELISTTTFTSTQLTHLECAFSVEEGAFATIYRGPNPTLELSKVLSSLIKERTRKILNAPEFHMGKFSPYLLRGFSDCELSHRWTEKTKASITIPLGEMEPRPSRISFLNTGGFVTDRYTQDLTVKMNGVIVDHYVYTLSHNDRTIDILLPKDRPLAKIKFEIPNAISPSELGIGSDKRKLGIAFREVQLHH